MTHQFSYPAALLERLHPGDRNNLEKAAAQFSKLHPLGGPAAKGAMPAPEAEKLLILCMTPRSGSTALSAALRATKRLGRGGEQLNFKPDGLLASLMQDHPDESLVQLLDRVIEYARGRSGVSQIKCDFAQIQPFFMDAQCYQRLRHAKLVYLTREDVLGQAISRFKGFATGMWHSVQSDDGKLPEASYDFGEIFKQVQFLTNMMASWERLFTIMDVRPLRITYEQLVEDAGQVATRIAGHVGVELDGPVTLADSGHKKVASASNEQMRAAFLADIEKLRSGTD